MYYSPHALQKWIGDEFTHDEHGRIAKTADGGWAEIISCRCDDNHTKLLRTKTGEVYRSSYKIVCDRTENVGMGDKVRCLNDDGTLRGEGFVGDLQRNNYLDYMVIWL